MVKTGLAVNFLIIRENKILLVKRNNNSSQFPGVWSIPGGGAEKGENIEETLFREISEELGCDIEFYTYFKSKYFVMSDDFHVRAVYFYGDIKGEIVLQEEELSEYKWFELNDDLLELDFAFNQEEIIKDFLLFEC